MKILISGCSFTGGSDVIHNAETGLLEPNRQQTWANLFETFMPEANINNIALGGNSNDKIFRRAFDELCDPVGPGYDYAIIQWTALHRQERYSCMIKDWVNFCNIGQVKTDDPYNKVVGTFDKGLYSWHVDDGKYMDPDHASISIERSFDLTNRALTAELLHGKSVQDFRIDYLKNVLVMQHALQSRNIPYLFTSMSNESHLPTIANGGSAFDYNPDNVMCDLERQLINGIDLDNWTRTPMSFMMDNNQLSHDDSHPNQLGHKLIYKHIHKHMHKDINQ